ncbi:glutathione S-transferase 1-like isoform X2 [Paramacrobiotus metropolitanus]|nr:glutathione S-transferase 1-like isoform X2 [Paramacrobiotus metropolitanus]
MGPLRNFGLIALQSLLFCGISFGEASSPESTNATSDSPTEMHTYKLVYFDGRGRGEFVRLLFATAGQKFEDYRVATPDWPAFKPKTPWGTVPYLEVDGKPLGETKVIIRLLGQRFGLLPSGDWDQALASSIVEKAMDIYDGMVKILFKTPDGEKANATKEYMEVSVPTILKDVEKFVTQHGTHGHCYGSKLTTADLSMFCAIDLLKEWKFVKDPAAFLTPYPKLKAVLDKTAHNEKVAHYLQTRK